MSGVRKVRFCVVRMSVSRFCFVKKKSRKQRVSASGFSIRAVGDGKDGGDVWGMGHGWCVPRAVGAWPDSGSEGRLPGS